LTQIFYHRPVAANGRRARRPSKGKTAIGLNVGRIIEALGFRHGAKEQAMTDTISAAQLHTRTIGKRLFAVSVLASVVFATRFAAAVVIIEYPVSGPVGITLGPDGNLWFTEDQANKIGKITTGGVVTEYAAAGQPNGITLGPDGNLWFTETNKIGKITTGGVVTEYAAAGRPNGITAGPDGNLWFTEIAADKIGKITTSGVITEYPVPTGSSGPEDITAGPDGNLWFTEIVADKIGKITTSGVITEYPLTANSAPIGIAAGPDGNLWFTEFGANQIGRITTGGSVTEYPIPTANSFPLGITLGPDGNLWFTEGKIGTITPGGVITEYPFPANTSNDITAGPDGNLWFTGDKQIGKVGLGITPTGVDVPVLAGTTIFNTKNNTDTDVAVDTTFASVTSAGITTVTATSTPTDLPLPSLTADVGLCSKTKSLGCQTDDDCPSGETCKGFHGVAFDISTTASVSGPFTVCQHYADNERRPKGKGGNGYVDGTGKPGLPETSLRLLHEENGVFVDVTSPGYPDTLNNVVCGQVSNLSASAAAASGRAAAVGTVQGTFGLYVKTDLPGGGDLTTDCWSEWSLCLPGSTGGGNVKVPKKKKGASAPVPDSLMTCTSSSSKCKTTLDGAAACNFCVRLCANVSDERLSCSPSDIKEYQLRTPTEQGQDNDSLNAGRIIDGLKGLSTGPPAVISGSGGATITLNPAASSPYVCTGPINIAIPVNGVAKSVKLTATTSSGQSDVDTLTLKCPK
jgi:streptogramin lyase